MKIYKAGELKETEKVVKLKDIKKALTVYSSEEIPGEDWLWTTEPSLGADTLKAKVVMIEEIK